MAFPDIPPAMEEVPGVRLDEPDAVLQGLPRPAIQLPQPDALAQGQQALPEGIQCCCDPTKCQIEVDKIS